MCVQAIANHLSGWGVIRESWYSVVSENGPCEITVHANEIYKRAGLSCWSRPPDPVRFARLLSKCGLNERHS